MQFSVETWNIYKLFNSCSFHVDINILFIKYMTQYLTQSSCTCFSALRNPVNEMKTLRDSHAVALLQDQAQVTLSKYIESTYPSQPFRFGKLLLLLPLLQTVSSKVIEDIFFKRTIGHVPIDKLIVDMFKSGDFWHSRIHWLLFFKNQHKRGFFFFIFTACALIVINLEYFVMNIQKYSC